MSISDIIAEYRYARHLGFGLVKATIIALPAWVIPALCVAITVVVQFGAAGQ